jgi:hypothetical protein
VCIAAIVLGTSTCVSREGSFSESGLSSNNEVCKLETPDRGNGQCSVQDYSAICRPREQESCLSEARISLLSAKGKARLVAGCSSGKYLTGVCATVFPLEGKSHVEMVERESKFNELDEPRRRRNTDIEVR